MAATAEKVMAGAAGTTQYLVFVVINLMLTSLFIKKRLIQYLVFVVINLLLTSLFIKKIFN